MAGCYLAAMQGPPPPEVLRVSTVQVACDGSGEIDPAWWWLPGASDIHIPAEFDSMQIFRYGEK